MSRVCTSGPVDRGSVSGRVIPKTQKMLLDSTLLNTQHYKVRIKSKVEQSWKRSSALPLHLGVVAIEKGAFWSPSTKVANFTYFYKPLLYLICEKSSCLNQNLYKEKTPNYSCIRRIIFPDFSTQELGIYILLKNYMTNIIIFMTRCPKVNYIYSPKLMCFTLLQISIGMCVLFLWFYYS